MHKLTTVFYPHIVKEYDSYDSMVTENGYEEYRQFVLNTLTEHGIDINDESVFKEELSDDGFEAIATVVFPNEEDFNAYMISAQRSTSFKKPIYEEEVDEHLI